MKKFTCFISLFMFVLLRSDFILAEPISFTTWNFEWLTNSPVENIPQSNRNKKDFSKLAEHATFIHPDILAFQEVNNISAIKGILNKQYKIYLSDRNKLINRRLQFENINQFTGFAVAENWQISDPQDLNLSPGHKLRFATYLILHHDAGRSIHLLSVHLKAGCRGKYRRNRSCTLLRHQGEKLNQWIKERQERQESFMILGDFNHNLAYPKDWFWQVLTGETDSSSEKYTILATRATEAECKVRSRRSPKRTYRYRNLIDHIVVSRDLAYAQPKQYVYPAEQVLDYRLSDHCPVTIQIDP